MLRKTFVLFALLFIFTTCEEEQTSCYDAEMEKMHSCICTQDCPGVCGCDGKTYCNECIANSQGIAITDTQPCK